jgi:hypothetical protein
MSLGISAWLYFAARLPVEGVTLGGVGIGGTVYASVGWALGVPEARQAVEVVVRKARRR